MISYTSVVFPEDSGPKISTIRPRGTPPTPSARSSESAPVGIASTWTALSSPSRITEPWPNWRSIWVTAACSAASFAFASLAAAAPPLESLEERGVIFFSSAILITFLSPARRTAHSIPQTGQQFQAGQGHVLGARRPQERAVEGHPNGAEGSQQGLGKGLGRALDCPWAATPAGSPR